MSLATERWRNLARVEAGRGGWHRKPSRIGLVDSYDPKTHSVKVRFQPQDQTDPNKNLSGWIPLTGLGVGDGFGILSAPNIGDQVEVIFQEGDHLSGRVMTRHWSNKRKPPEIQAGEHYLVHQSGAVIKFLKDGTLEIAGAGTQKTNQTQSQQGQSGQQGQGSQQSGAQQQPQALQSIVLDPQGNLTVKTPQGGMTYSASGAMSFTAETINLN